MSKEYLRKIKMCSKTTNSLQVKHCCTSNELPVHSTYSIQNTAPWTRYQSSEEENSSTYLTEAVKETDIRSSDANV